ncbi:MAG: hypothetical protein ACREQV_21225 [Candidatus Binatia bacterium]
MRLVATLAGALIGAVAGYFLGVHIACDWLYPASNLCGIYGVFITAPIGLASGAAAGWIMSRPQIP